MKDKSLNLKHDILFKTEQQQKQTSQGLYYEPWKEMFSPIFAC